MKGLWVLLLALLAGQAMAWEKGIQDGWVLDDQLEIRLTREQAREMHDLGARWVRVHFRLTGGRDTWDPELIAAYSTAVRNAELEGLRVLGLFTYESHRGSQADWIENSLELAGGSGDNDYIRKWARDFGKIAKAFPSVSYWEIWNEPNCWTKNPPGDATKLPEGYYVYPSNLAWIMRRAFDAVAGLPIRPKLLSPAMLVGPFHPTIEENLASPYWRAVVASGNEKAGWATIRRKWNQNPFDIFSIHFYVFGDGKFEPAQYEEYLVAFAKLADELEPEAARAPIWVTEVGFSAKTAEEEQGQVSGVRNLFRAFSASNRYGPVIWFKYRDEPLADLYFGLRRSDGSAKPALTEFRSAAPPD